MSVPPISNFYNSNISKDKNKLGSVCIENSQATRSSSTYKRIGNESILYRSEEEKIVEEIFESLGKAIKGPTISYEYNNATIQNIQADKLTLRIKHLDVMMT